MASHVVVIDASARRHTIKTSPNTYLSDVLQSACSKLGLTADKYTLKHNGKQLDLSLPIRLANLNNGAKLNLIQSSKSPSVVQVALQLSPGVLEKCPTGTSSRLVDKFPSTTSLWQILRRFESGVAGGAATTSSQRLNFTQNARPQMAHGAESGSGRLYYEMPVINVMGREIGSLVDLQKTLAQLGLNSGNVLMRFDLRGTEQPLDEAMADITAYFEQEDQRNGEESRAEPSAGGLNGPASLTKQLEEASETQKATDETPEGTTKPDEPTTSSMTPDNAATSQPPPQTEPTDTPMAEAPTNTDTPGPSHSTKPTTNPTLSIYSPPTNSNPTAASTPFNPSDYEPTLDHAKQHQSLLSTTSRNTKLPSDAEIAATRAAAAERRAAIQSVVVRLKFPDESVVEKTVGREETGAGLYAVLAEVSVAGLGGLVELRVAGQGGRGMKVERVECDQRRLIGDLGWSGRVMVMVVWKDAKEGGKWGRKPCLKPEYSSQGKQLEVDADPGAETDAPMEGSGHSGAAGEGNKKGRGAARGGDVEAKMKKFLGFGKK